MSSAVTSIGRPEEDIEPDDRPHAPSQLVADAITNYSATIFSACVGLVMVPILLHALGTAAYGLLLTSLMVGGMLPFDLGLGWSLTHEIAKAKADSSQPVSRFVGLAGWLFLALGLVGSTVVIGFGFFFARLHPSDGQSVPTTELIFLLAGIGFLGEHMQVYILSVFHGLRRFASANLILMTSVLVRAIGSYVLVRSGMGLIPIAIWLASISLLTGICGVAFVCQADPALRWLGEMPRWADIREHLSLAFSGQATMTATSWLWQCTPLLAGVMRGAASVVPFYIGQRFPLIVSFLSWKAAEPMFPAASSAYSDMERHQNVFVPGTRWIAMVSLPLCIFLWIDAPIFLNLWIGNYPPGAVFILRLTTMAVFADSLSVGAVHFLLAAAAAKKVLITTVIITFAAVLLSCAFLYFLDPPYAIWGLVLPMLAGTAVFLRLVHQHSNVGSRDLIRLLIQLCLPGSIFAAILWTSYRILEPRSLERLLEMAVGAGAAYAVALYFCHLSSAERRSAKHFVMARINLIVHLSGLR